MQKNKITGLLYPAFVLLIISALIALLLGIVNSITSPVIAENTLQTKSNQIKALFPDLIGEPVTIDFTYDESDELIEVALPESKKGYCVLVSPTGFGGEIGMMVGFDSDLKIVGIRYIGSHSETPGLGAKVMESAFTDQYIGKSGVVTLNKDGVDSITGATISSRAITLGVNNATKIIEAYLNGGDSDE